MRIVCYLLLIAFTAVLLAPGFIVGDFLFERQRIQRDLCVQRMVPDAQRTCHGQCCLMKRLRKAEQKEQGVPAELRSLRLDDAVPTSVGARMVVPQVVSVINAGARCALPLEGFVGSSDPVPWC